MIKNYSLFYSYKQIGDVLMVIIENEKPTTRHIRNGSVEVLYHEEEIIGYNIFDISEVIKIKTRGKIFLPSPILIKVINTILKNSGAEELDEIHESGYVIGQVKEVKEIDNKKVLKVDISKEIVTALTSGDINVNDYIVIAKLNTMLNNGEVIKICSYANETINAHVCNEKELQISDNEEPLIIKEEVTIGMDFFMEGEN
ncbi:MAG: DUF4479 domain-containing protein [Bacilli bacterium]|nr:DUF4479 domain-containing protein [Bacilli bacterium]